MNRNEFTRICLTGVVAVVTALNALAAVVYGGEVGAMPFGGSLDGLAVCTEQKSGSIVLVDASKAGAPAFAWEWNPKRDPGIREEHIRWFLTPSDCRMLPGRVLLMADSGGGFARILLATGRADAYGYVGGNPHAIEPLPGGQFVVTASSHGKCITLVDISKHPMEPEKQVKRCYPLADAHGVVWDARRHCLWAIGGRSIVRFAWHSQSQELSETARFDFNAIAGDGGHELQSDGRAGFFFTTMSKVAHFDPDTGTVRVIRDRKDVKSFSRNVQYGDLLAVVREVWWTDRLLVDKDGAEYVVGPYPGARFYKARWAATNAALPSEAHMDWLKCGIISIVHFGLNTYADQEWGFGDVDPKLFNPTKLDARQWVAAAKAGGIRRMVLVAKHHDGFCLWPSKLNADYTVANLPWKGGKGDLVKELRDACVEAGLEFGVYLSPWDRHHAEYARPAYVDYFHGQWDDIMANYGPISEIWLDGANGGDGWYGGAKGRRTIPKDYYKLLWLQERLCRNYPRAVAFGGKGANCVRWCGNEAGFNAETCRHAVDGYWRPPEADTPLRGGWFWHPYDAPKSLKVLVDSYFWCVGRNAVLNLGLAPNREGLIGEDDVARLKEFGDYVRAYESSDVSTDAKLETSADGRIATLTAAKPMKFSAVDLGENILRGQRVDAFAVEAKVGGVWKELAKATTIGYRRILRIPETEATAVRLVVTKATANPEICSFRLRVAPEVPEAFVSSGLDFISRSKLKIRTSTNPMFVWYRLNEKTNLKLRGFAYKPSADTLDGVVDRWAVDVKRKGRDWECVEEGEFGNMLANPTTQTVVFKQPVEGLEVRIRAVRAVEGKPRFLVQQLDVFK